MSMLAQHDRGVTIIEIVVVLALLGVLITVVTPSMRGMIQRQHVQGVHDQLVTDLQLARSELTARGGVPTSIAVKFGGDATLTCYTIHTAGGGATCDCTRTPGQACLPAGILQEIKTVQVPRAQGVSLAASSAGGSTVTFAPPQGVASPNDMVINVQGDAGGQLRTSVQSLRSPTVCSPGGSIRGVPAC